MQNIQDRQDNDPNWTEVKLSWVETAQRKAWDLSA